MTSTRIRLPVPSAPSVAEGAGENPMPATPRASRRSSRLRGGPRAAVYVAAATTLPASVLLAVGIGSAGIGIIDVWQTVVAHLAGMPSPLSPLRDGIVWDIRLTRVLTAAAVGAALAVSGAVMQALTRNVLADPYLLGLSSGASVGAVAALMLGVAIMPTVAAFLGALAALTLTLLLARSLGPISPSRTILAGITVSAFGVAVTSFLIFWNVQGDSYREVLNWLMGSLAGSGWATVAVSWAVTAVIGIPLVLGARVLDAFAFGDTAAASLGIHVTRARWIFLAVVALLTGMAVAVSGAIGFIGLVLPNAARLLVGFRHRLILPLCALAGATFMIWVDTGARTLFAPRELPVGIMTALVGAPIFALVLWRHRSRS